MAAPDRVAASKRRESTPLPHYTVPRALCTTSSISPHESEHFHQVNRFLAHKMANTQKKTVLVIGGGAVGAIAALNLEAGGLSTVTVVLRSNYDAVHEKGYRIESCDHGLIEAFHPSIGTQVANIDR
jgi:heterodisulfide reductase subunit A-like polyferredoxin